MKTKSFTNKHETATIAPSRMKLVSKLPAIITNAKATTAEALAKIKNMKAG